MEEISKQMDDDINSNLSKIIRRKQREENNYREIMRSEDDCEYHRQWISCC